MIGFTNQVLVSRFEVLAPSTYNLTTKANGVSV